MTAQFNDSYYSGADYYSDGCIEEEILNIVKSEKDFTHILSNDNRWPILYHFSQNRRNILSWYPFFEQATLLEVGGGCGALTGLFCDKVKNVTVIELSKRRAEIIYHRHLQRANLSIFPGNLHEIKFEQKFDYVTCIGVLEYAGKFSISLTPHKDFLCSIKTLLKSNGKLLLAIENKFGLKYFAGASEDHTGKVFDGIEGYLNGKDVITFGKQELINLLREAGFNKLEFYYPYPDYKLPKVIYSDDKLPSIVDFLEASPNYDIEKFQLFNESLAYKEIIRNQQFDFFSNSYLIEASIEG